MPTATDLRGERGSATVEFLTLSLVLLVPVVYLLVYASQVQAAAFAAVAAADQAAKVVVSGTEGVSAAQAHSTVLLTLKDYGITADLFTADVGCSVGDCMTLDPGEVVEARVDVDVPLPLVPGLGGEALSPVQVGSSARQMVPRF